MTTDEIRKKAPAGATHYFTCTDGDVIYYEYRSLSLKWFNNGKWSFCFDPQEPVYKDSIYNLQPL